MKRPSPYSIPQGKRKNTNRTISLSSLDKCSADDVCSLLSSVIIWSGKISRYVVTQDHLLLFHDILDGNLISSLLEYDLESMEKILQKKRLENNKAQLPLSTIELVANSIAKKLLTFKDLNFYILWDINTTNRALFKQFPTRWVNNAQVDGNLLKGLINEMSRAELFKQVLHLPKELYNDIIKWIQELDIIQVPDVRIPELKIKSVLEKFSTGTTHSLAYPKINIPFHTTDGIINKISNAFESLLNARESQCIRIPFLACAPGTGKSRTLQEIFPYTKQGKLNNSIQILVSFANGTPIVKTEEEKAQSHPLSPEDELTSRILYSYYNIADPFKQFQQKFADSKITLPEALAYIYYDFNGNSTNDDLYIYLDLDEFTELLRFNIDIFDSVNNTVKKRSYLEIIMKMLGSLIINGNKCSSKIHILPLFAGLDYQMFTYSISESSYQFEYINPYIFNTADISNIISTYLPSLRLSPYLWKVTGLLGSNNRFLENLIDHIISLKLETPTSNDIKWAYNSVSTTFFGLKSKLDLSAQAAKKLIAKVILGEEVKIFEAFDKVNNTEFTWKQLEDSGMIRLLMKSDETASVTASFECIKYCSFRLGDEYFSKFWDMLFESIFSNTISYDRPFETFNGLFDILRNKCLLFLSKKNISLKERFPGIVTKITDFSIDLETLPKMLSEIPPDLDNNAMIQNPTQNACFFDRYSKCTTNSEISFILWQDRGISTDITNFTQREISEIENDHFTDEKLGLINTSKGKCLAIVITSRPASKVLKLPDRFAIIDRKGLYEYYGPFVSSIFFHSIPLPFPIYQTDRYSSLDLARFLGIEKRAAKIIIDNINKNTNNAEITKICNSEELNSLIDIGTGSEDYVLCDVPTDGNCF